MKAAIYGRKSTLQTDADDEVRSVARQVENARVFATAKGWAVHEDHIYQDDGISAASSLARLPAKARLHAAIMGTGTPPFDVLIRFGYTNAKVEKHCDLVVNEDERPVVVRIFDLFATGEGYTRIAKMLNAEGARSPRPQRDRPAAGGAASVRA